MHQLARISWKRKLLPIDSIVLAQALQTDRSPQQVPGHMLKGPAVPERFRQGIIPSGTHNEHNSGTR